MKHEDINRIPPFFRFVIFIFVLQNDFLFLYFYFINFIKKNKFYKMNDVSVDNSKV